MLQLPNSLKLHLVLCALISGFTPTVWAAPELSSDQNVEYQGDSEKLIARGNARLEDNRYTLVADEISLDQSKMLAEASGAVELNYENLRILSPYASYDYHNDYFHAQDTELGYFPYYLCAGEVEGTRDNLTLCDTTLFYGEPDCTTLTLESDRVELEPGCETIKAWGNVVKIGSVPVFYLPYVRADHMERPFSWQTDIGHTSRLGWFMRNTVLFPVFEDIKVGALLDYYEKAGFLKGPALSYDHCSEDHYFEGDFEAGFIHDFSNNRGNDVLGRPIPEPRYFYEYRHIGESFCRIDTVAKLSSWSDSEVTRNFRPGEYYDHNQKPDTYFEGTYRGDNYFISAFTRVKTTDFQVISERLPEVRLDVMPIPVTCIMDEPIYLQGFASGAHLRKKFLDGRPELHTNRFDGYFGGFIPIQVNPWLTITPVAGGRLTSYGDSQGAPNNADSYTRGLGQIGLDVQTVFTGYWDVCCPNWNIDEIRHIARPIAQYRFIPEGETGNSSIPHIDRDVFVTSLEPLDLALKRDTDDIHELNTLRLGFQNLIQTRSCDCYIPRDLLRIDFYQDLRFHPTENAANPIDSRHHYSDFYTELLFTPADFFSYGSFSRIDPHTGTLEEFKNAIRICDGDTNYLSFGNSYLKQASMPNQTNQYFIRADHRMTERFSVFGFWAYDAHLQEITTQTYGFRILVGHSWSVCADVTLRRTDTQDGPTTFNVRIDLMSF